MSATILDFKNLYFQIQSTNLFTKVKSKSKTDWNLNNLYTDYRLFELDFSTVDVSIADLSNKINRLLYDIDITDDDVTELKNLCSDNQIIFLKLNIIKKVIMILKEMFSLAKNHKTVIFLMMTTIGFLPHRYHKKDQLA